MAILAFQKPDKVIMLEGTDTVGRFEFRPLEPGYGQTIGNALRRILLSSLEGFAITSIKVSGVDQEFAPIPGVIDVIAKPSREDNKIRRSALPIVCPYPGSKGLNSKRPTVSVPSSIITLSGF